MMSRYGNFADFLPWIVPLVILDLVLKGFALWRSARNGQNIWFVAILLVNSVGILPGIYLLFFSKTKKVKK